MVARPDPSSPASFYTSVQSLCDAADSAAALLSALQVTLGNVQSGLSSEIQARQQAISAEAAARGEAISQAAQDLRSAITSLGDSLRQALNSEATARSNADSAEQESRQQDVQALGKQITDAVAALRLLIGIKADASALSAVDQAQTQALEKEIADRTAAIEAALATVRGITDAISASAAAQGTELALNPDRPGDAPGRFSFVSTVGAVAGPRNALPFVPAAMVAVGDSGAVVRVIGSGIVATRRAFPAEIGRLYRARFVVQRRVNPGDPSGDAVTCGLVCLDGALRVVGSLFALATFQALTTSYGRREIQALLSRSAGLGADYTVPAAARFIVPVVVTYGPDAVTDVEVLGLEDVSGAFVLPAPSADETARLAAIENANLPARVETLEQEVGAPSKLTFGAKGDARYATVPATVLVVELLGATFAGDGGGGLYARAVGTPPDGSDTFVSGGSTWVRVQTAQAVAEDAFARFYAGLPVMPPDAPGRPWRNGDAIAWTPLAS